MHPFVEKKIHLQDELQIYFAQPLLKAGIETNLRLLDLLINDPVNCTEFTTTRKVFLANKRIATKAKLNDWATINGIFVRVFDDIHNEATNIHELGCASQIEVV